MNVSQSSPTPLVWRFPPYQPAIGFLVAAACAALAIYAHPPVATAVVLAVIAVIAIAVAVVLLRMALVVDDDGIAVRFIGRVNWIPWDQVKAVGLADVRGNETVRIMRVDDTQVDVPPSLLQPVRPTSKFKASSRLRGIVTSITARRPGPFPSS